MSTIPHRLRRSAIRLARTTTRAFGFDVVRVAPERRTLLHHLASLDIATVLDVGANEGQFATLACKTFPRAVVHSFEPLPGPRAQLERVARESNGRVFVHAVALGDANGSTRMHVHDGWSPSSSVLASTPGSLELFPMTERQSTLDVEVARLDDYLERRGISLESPVLLKADVQGFEDRVLRGGPRVLASARAAMLEVPVTPLYEGQATFQAVHRLCDQAGLEFVGTYEQHHSERGDVLWFDAIYVRAER